ncbi:MAG TPA: DUF429 domain-containing protein [Bdellovibrionota bacterium]|nr:DUF429 domain-containing protein [Bdellovibrionota bacterium]
MRNSSRYLGLELAGAKNQKTALAVLEYYPTEQKVFLLDIYDRIAMEERESSDEALIALIEEFKPGVGPEAGRQVSKIGVNVPLMLPPCAACVRKACPMPAKCSVPAVRWMRGVTRKAARRPSTKKTVREFTPYTQRPIELHMRYEVMPGLPLSHRFEIDEALGGNRAPLTARMNFLLRHLAGGSGWIDAGDLDRAGVIEIWPKLSVALLGIELGIPKRTISQYRHLEQGGHSREEILEALVEKHGLFVYDRDLRKLSQSLACFDAFICAYTALLADIGKCVKSPAGFPVKSGWINFPAKSSGARG